MRIAVAGAGYVGLSNAILLAQHNRVILVDPNSEKIQKLKNKISPIADKDISFYLSNYELHLSATSDSENAYKDADCVIIATPTDYSYERGSIDTTTVEQVIGTVLQVNKYAVIVIKSTVPVGFTKRMAELTKYDRILFSPEFLREGYALHDCLYPSRIIIGIPVVSDALTKLAQNISNILSRGAKTSSELPVLFMGSSEAESVKLFSNTFLAMRISFFNELDTYAETMGLKSENIITGVGLDPRVGMYYNNPSFGYGGYCLPKDTKGLLANYNGIPQDLISAVVKSNETRKSYIASQILKRGPKKIGIYRLVMKKDGDNFRESSIRDIMKKLQTYCLSIVIYEPLLTENQYEGFQVIDDLEEFASQSDVILANRITSELEMFAEKVYTRDLFREN